MVEMAQGYDLYKHGMNIVRKNNYDKISARTI